ncbi:CpaD family pilus assembly lipoprotein [Sphingomonas sp. MMS24-J13]|uniref:CpaD family pilus assembly lipoprotein n=1 Tax=Sphingomonas sp. MMS24-J13 TaxID=3238686 RepID=UPI00384C00B8
MIRSCFTMVAAAIALTGCAAGDRGLVSTHQPVVSEAGATVPHCPNWQPEERGEQEGQSSNYGCASAVNLAAMVADPADLVRGKSEATSLAETAVRALKALRDAGTTGKGNTVEKISAKAAN